MWLYAQKGFLSVVAHRDKPDVMIVRSRFEGDIEALFPWVAKGDVSNTPQWDYDYRIELSRDAVVAGVAQAVEAIDYDCFKSNIADHSRDPLYMRVWTLMQRATLGLADAYSFVMDAAREDVGDDVTDEVT